MGPEVYTRAVAAADGIAYGFTAQALYISATCSSGLTVTLQDGSTTVALGNAVIGTTIPIATTKAAFAAGGVIALRLRA